MYQLLSWQREATGIAQKTAKRYWRTKSKIERKKGRTGKCCQLLI